MSLWKKLVGRRGESRTERNTGDEQPPATLDARETYEQQVVQIPEKFANVPEGYTVEHLSWKEYEATGLNEGIDLAEVMSPRELAKVWFDVLRDPDGNIVAERDQAGGRWWTLEEKEAEKQAWWAFEDEL